MNWRKPGRPARLEALFRETGAGPTPQGPPTSSPPSGGGEPHAGDLVRTKQTGWKTILVLSLVLAGLAVAVLAAERVGAPGEARRMGGFWRRSSRRDADEPDEIRVTDREVLRPLGLAGRQARPLHGVESIEVEKIPGPAWKKFTKGASWFSVSPGPGLRFRLKNGKSVVVGTPDPTDS